VAVTRLELVVDEVVLHGIDPRDRHRVGDAIERELRARIARESVVERIARDVHSREQVVTNVVSASVRSAVAHPAVRKG
jgi:hypothetical protein